uniref:cell surface A33 antigen-like n=1 Tax=Semicossyphus pulcher TaxID=241346 RepID=UPI0037E9A1DB
MEGRICSLTLLFLVLSGAGALQVNIPDEIYEHARGDNISLPCSFTSKNLGGLVVISWSVKEIKANAKEILILTYYSSKGITDIKAIYEGRVSMDVDVPKGQANLKLNSITLGDNKIFECRVQIPGDDEGKPADTTRLVVLVAPSTPICKIQGKAEYGQNINLTCKSKEGSPAPTYSWESRDVRNVPRVATPRATTNGIKSLYNISKETSGYYICTSKNKIRSATCNLTLAVMPPSMTLGSAGIIGIVVAAVAALIIGIIIYCCCCRKKKQQEEYAMGVREEYTDKEPARNGESRQADGQEDPRGYDDSSVRSPDRYEEQSERNYDSRRDYDDRRSDYDDRRSDYDDRRSDYDDRRDKYSDRHERYEDERGYDDERRYNDSRDRRRDERDRRDDDDRRYEDDRHNDDRYNEPDDDRERGRPPVPPSNKPRRDYDD